MIYGQISFLIFVGLFCIIVQSNSFLHSHILPIGFDLTIPLTLYVGLSQKPPQGALLAVWFGFLMDVFSGSIMGMYTFLRVSMFLLVQILKKGLFLENKVFFGLLVLALFFWEAFLVSLLFALTGVRLFLWENLFTLPFTHGLFTVFLWYLISPGFISLEGFFRKA